MLAVMAGLAFAVGACAPAAPPPSTATQPPAPAVAGTGFSGRILPIFRSQCIDCHLGSNAPRDLELDSYQHVIRGSSNGPVVVPGAPDRSRIVEMVRFGFMPMGKPRLPQADVQAIIDWIAEGAPES